MSRQNQLSKICARCSFLVPLERSRCKTCGSRTFLTEAQHDLIDTDNGAVWTVIDHIYGKILRFSTAMQAMVTAWKENIREPKPDMCTTTEEVVHAESRNVVQGMSILRRSRDSR